MSKKDMKIKGLSITYDFENLKIRNSYKIIDKDKMENILNIALDRSEFYVPHRTMKSLINQWISNNFLYKINKKYKDINFQKTIKKRYDILYSILSFPTNFKYFINNKILYKIKRIRKEKQYNKYIKEHKKNVENAYLELKENTYVVQKVGIDIISSLKDRVAAHDLSKYSQEEFEPYRKNFYPVSWKEKENNLKDFNDAWLHHIRENSHHWQHRKNKKTFDPNNPEEVLDILENILDWLAMGYKFGDRPYQYYEHNKNNIKLNDDERKFLEDLIYNGIDSNYKGEFYGSNESLRNE